MSHDTHTLSVLIEADVHKEIKLICDASDRTVSDFVRSALNEAVHRFGTDPKIRAKIIDHLREQTARVKP